MGLECSHYRSCNLFKQKKKFQWLEVRSEMLNLPCFKLPFHKTLHITDEKRIVLQWEKPSKFHVPHRVQLRITSDGTDDDHVALDGVQGEHSITSMIDSTKTTPAI